MAKRPDIQISGCNGFYQITPITKKAKRWFDENVQSEGWQWLGGSLGIDNGGLLDDIACGAQAAGLEVA